MKEYKMEMEMKSEFYQVHFVYKDGKDLNMNVTQEQLKGLFESLSSNTIYWVGDDNDKYKSGFWTNLEDIRYIEFKTIQKEDDNDQRKLDEGSKELPIEEAEIVGEAKSNP